MKRILHHNPITQRNLNRLYLSAITSETFADLSELNMAIRKNKIVRLVAA